MSKGYPNICAFNKSSEAGNDKFAFSIFLSGCNLTCPYCMNPDLTKDGILPYLDNKKLEDIIVEERPRTIHVSGGEPTNNMWNLMGLVNWFNYLKETHNIKFNVGISTNGTLKGRVGSVLKHFDFVTMDLKGDPFDYTVRFNGGQNSFFNMIESWRDIRIDKQVFEYEIRTTLSPNIIDEGKIRFMSKFFRKDEKWVLQPYRATSKMLCFEREKDKEYSDRYINQLVDLAISESGADVELRYV